MLAFDEVRVDILGAGSGGRVGFIDNTGTLRMQPGDHLSQMTHLDHLEPGLADVIDLRKRIAGEK